MKNHNTNISQLNPYRKERKNTPKPNERSLPNDIQNEKE